MERYFTVDEVMNFPVEDLPLIVLSDNLRSFLAWGIKAHQSGNYNHFMWMHKRGMVASQDATYRATSIEPYLTHCRLKFWRAPEWQTTGKGLILQLAIKKDLAATRGRWSGWYDWLQIVGKLIHCDWLQIPGREICSDKIKYIFPIDPEAKKTFHGKHPSPSDINKWLKTQPRYQVYGRYSPD